jgi:CRP-like cAMP-binding protein
MNHREILKNVYLFKNISQADLEALAEISSVENFAPNDEVFSQDDKALALYLVKHGSVKIVQKTKSGDLVSVANLGVGAHFGEMAFLDGATRSATATAAEKSEIVVIPYDKLLALVKARSEFAVKVYREMAIFLAGRLRVTTSDLSFSREKNLSHF